MSSLSYTGNYGFFCIYPKSFASFALDVVLFGVPPKATADLLITADDFEPVSLAATPLMAVLPSVFICEGLLTGVRNESLTPASMIASVDCATAGFLAKGVPLGCAASTVFFAKLFRRTLDCGTAVAGLGGFRLTSVVAAADLTACVDEACNFKALLCHFGLVVAVGVCLGFANPHCGFALVGLVMGVRLGPSVDCVSGMFLCLTGEYAVFGLEPSTLLVRPVASVFPSLVLLSNL